MTSAGIDWQREKWQSGLGSKFIHQGEKNAAKYADEVIVLSKGVQDYFKETYGRKTHFIPNGVNMPQIREASLITDKFGLKKDSYILFLGRLVPEKGIRYLVEAFKNVKTDKKLVIAGGSSDTDSFMAELKELASGDDRILFTGFVQGTMLDELYSNAYIQVLLEANGLAAGKDHQFKGRYDAEKNAVIISLEKDEQSALSPQKRTT
ncbi:glycosyltransferase family 4 protein [Faecalibacterium duncaniae]|uniref:glycosyltransferase family 4 protein n=1 Tax=Faecalibacterium duncaniae (strain DSM 17677 / JCM 31915 / A2-165) TaxID=411483 RepID=UPI003EDAE655